ncbi:hypothetical protein TSUD_230450 [Trifolium subterraneum]|nr:hypothetical protein TSUD_230450 [Trifolium subterraneum]
MTFTVVFHHGGLFVREWVIFYKGGKKKEVVIIDPDKWSYFEAVGHLDDIIKKEGYVGGYRMWWKPDEEYDYKLLRVDEDANEVCNYAMKNKGRVQMYVEHDVDDVSCLVTIPNYVNAEELVASDDGVDVGVVGENQKDKGKGVVVEFDYDEAEDYSSVDDDSSEDEANGITFDDSEDERALGSADGFGLPYAAPMNGSNRVYIEGLSYRVKMGANKSTTTKKSKPTIAEEMLELADIECAYVSDELNSSDPDDSDQEKGPRNEKFRMEQLNKDFEFKRGMEFNSLHDFKEAIRECAEVRGAMQNGDTNGESL